LEDLPIEFLSAKIATCVAAAAADPMEDLRRFRATCMQMRTVCSNIVVGRSIPLLPVLQHSEGWGLFYDEEYCTQLITKLANVGNPEACFYARLQAVFMEEHGTLTPCLDMLQHASEAGHEDATFVLSPLLHRSNSGAAKDDNARRLLRKVKGGEGPLVLNAMWKNKNCTRCLQHALPWLGDFLWWKVVGKSLQPIAKPVRRQEHHYRGGGCDNPVKWEGWDEWVLFCSEECRIKYECRRFFKSLYWPDRLLDYEVGW
jgi:hypothetical protein